MRRKMKRDLADGRREMQRPFFRLGVLTCTYLREISVGFSLPLQVKSTTLF